MRPVAPTCLCADAFRYESAACWSAAMPLPEDAVANAVAKLDGMVGDLMSATGHSLVMAVAVVHGWKERLVRQGFRRSARRVSRTRSTATACSSWRRCPGQTAVRHGRRPPGFGGRRCARLDTPVASPAAVVRAVRSRRSTGMLSVGDLFGHRSGWPDYARWATGSRRTSATTAATVLEARLAATTAAQFRRRRTRTPPTSVVTAGGRGGGIAAAGAVLGGPQRTAACCTGRWGAASTSSRFADFSEHGRTGPSGTSRTDLAGTRRASPATATPSHPRRAGSVPRSTTSRSWLRMVLRRRQVRRQATVARTLQALLPAVTPQMAVRTRRAGPAMRPGFYRVRVQRRHLCVRAHASSGTPERSTLGAATNFVIIPGRPTWRSSR
jgi:hypothetical protein